MSVCFLMDEKRGVAYNGMRVLKSADGQFVDNVVDWSDVKNPNLKVMLMDHERAIITQDTLRIMGYDASIVHMSQDATPNWLFYGAIAMLVGYIVATTFL